MENDELKKLQIKPTNNFFKERQDKIVQVVQNVMDKFSSAGERSVYFTVDAVGSLDALVFGRQGIVSVQLCQDTDNCSKYAWRLSYPDTGAFEKLFEKRTSNTASPEDINFQKFVIEEIESQNKEGSEWNHIGWTHTYSGDMGKLYKDEEKAISALYTDEIYEELSYDDNEKI